MTTYTIDDHDLDALRTIRTWILDPRRNPRAGEALAAWIENLIPGSDPAPVHVFLVEGYGPFPWHGLTVARAWPYANIDAQALRRSAYRRVIALESAQAPDAAHWDEYGWTLRTVTLPLPEPKHGRR
jgi:hypothetical protein